MEILVETQSALIGLGGVLIGGALQWIVARSTIRSETERLHRQLSTEFQLSQFSEWQTEFRTVISEILAATDPEVKTQNIKITLIPLIHRAQLMLNPRLRSHAQVNALINEMALQVTSWNEPYDLATALRLHNQLLEASREILFLPS